MAKRIKGFVPFGKKGGAKVKAMPSDNDGDEKGAGKPGKSGNPFAAMSKKGK